MMPRVIFLITIGILCVSGYNSRNFKSFGSEDDLSIEHLKEHYGNKIEIEKHTSSADRKFYYFQVGDTNKDHYLDGIELFKMITEHSDDGKERIDVESVELQVDKVISDIDKNNDGMISFSEYSRRFSA